MGQNPPIDVQPLDPNTKCFTPDWYDRLRYLDALQPLSDIVFPDPGHDATKSDLLRAINSQTGTTYTFALTDNGKYCRFANASAVTVTVPPNSSVAFSIGTQIDCTQSGAGKVTFSPGSGVTINSPGTNKSIAQQWAGVTLIKVDTNTWDLTGALIA